MRLQGLWKRSSCVDVDFGCFRNVGERISHLQDNLNERSDWYLCIFRIVECSEMGQCSILISSEVPSIQLPFPLLSVNEESIQKKKLTC